MGYVEYDYMFENLLLKEQQKKCYHTQYKIIRCIWPIMSKEYYWLCECVNCKIEVNLTDNDLFYINIFKG